MKKYLTLNVLLYTVAFGLIAVAGFKKFYVPYREEQRRLAQNSELAAHIRATATAQPVVKGLYPAIIYSNPRNIPGKEFIQSVAFIYKDTDGEFCAVTSEHLFSMADNPPESSFRVEPLDRNKFPKPFYFSKVLLTGSTAKVKGDYVILKLGDEPVWLKTYSSLSRKEPDVKITFGLDAISNTGTYNARSLLSGTFSAVVGKAVQPGLGSCEIVINQLTHNGDSGTLYIDEQKRLWSLVGSITSSAISEVMGKDKDRMFGDKKIAGFTILSGPIPLAFNAN